MAFLCDAATLERLEWPRLVRALAGCAATRRGAEACARELFAATRAGAQELAEETAEARSLLAEGAPLGLHEVADLRALMGSLGSGRLPEASQLAEVVRTLRAAGRLRSLLAEHARAPRLADLARTLPRLDALRDSIERAVTNEGEVREDATPELRRARRQARDLESEIERRMASLLRQSDIQRHLQEHYATSRDDRPVLPVRADARGQVRGIVHDVSASGTTVFIEPEACIEPGNRLRIARREIEREVERLLRALGDACAAESEAIEATGATLEHIDLALARARLADRLGAQPVEQTDSGSLELRALAHPLLALEAGLPGGGVPNDVLLEPMTRGLVISGPNAGGKTVLAKAVGLAALSARAGLQILCADGSRMPTFDAVFADIGDAQDLRSGLSTFSARMATLARIVAQSGPHALVILDEIGEGTEPGEGAALAQAALEALVERGATVIATTHFNRLKELAGTDPRFVNACAEFDAATLAPTYRVRVGVPGSSGAVWVAQRMGLQAEVTERARRLMDHEDRKLEALTRSLSELRQELEGEREQAERARLSSDAAREDYERRLERLRAAREQALAAMRSELEEAYREARGEIAEIMRRLQRGDRSDGTAANLAHGELSEIRERVEQTEARHAEPRRRERAPRALDWERIEPGARLQVSGLAGEAVLVELPDKRGRIVIRCGTGRVTLDRERVQRVLGGARPRPKPTLRSMHVEIERSEAPEGLSPECDLRGLRVDEALDRADAHLTQVLGSGAESITFIHGHGTGALRSAIREWLRSAPGVAGFEPAAQRAGGDGVTVAKLAH